MPLSEVSKVVPLRPRQCSCCQHELGGTDPEPHRHQVIELPPTQPTVTEYQLHRLRCSECGATTRAELPKDVPRGSFGPRLQAMVALASGVYRMSKRTIEGFFSDLCRIRISLGSISNLEHKTSEALAQPMAEAHRYLHQQRVLHADETGWRQGRRRMWLWLAATAQVAVFLIRPHRSKKVAKELLGGFHGYLVTDRMTSYMLVPAERRQVCWSHLLRDIEAFRSLGRGGKQLATSVQRPMRQILHLYHRMCAEGLSRRWLQRQCRPLQQEVLYHLRRGATWRHRAIAGVCSAILKLKDALFTFIAHEGIEPTNNHSERLLRHAVLWRKSSFGTDSPRGSRFVERILSAYTSLRLQKRNVLDYLTEVARAALLNAPPPSLLPALPVAP